MKTGLGLYRKYRMLYAYLNLFRFRLRKILAGFDVANIFIQRVDKYSVQLILKRHGATIGEACDIETGLVFHNCNNYSNLVVGNNCHIGKDCFFDLKDKIIIGNNVTISMKNTVVTHIDTGNSQLKRIYPIEHKSVKIEDDSYIGANSVMLMGVTLSEGSFVAAGSVVTRDVPPFTMVGGVPAKEIKKLAINNLL